MATQVICPHCQSQLLLPDDCGGQTTRCPSCLKPFVIPGPTATTLPPTAQLAPESIAVAPETEHPPNEADLKHAQQLFESLTAENVGLQVELARQERFRHKLARREQWLRRFQSGRTRLDHSIGRNGGFFVTLALAPALAIVLASMVGVAGVGLAIVVLLAMLLAGLAYVPFAFYPEDTKLTSLLPQYVQWRGEADVAHRQLAAAEAAQREKLLAAEAEYHRIKLAVSSRLAWLRSAQWEQMNGKSLVKFLEQVFDEHGYTVEPTGKKGQVGIDLVVARDGVRVAVQAKGVQSGPVDPKIVQQTQAGQGMYRCHRSVLITNTQFLPSAHQLASKLNVRLIDANDIPALIEGEIVV